MICLRRVIAQPDALLVGDDRQRETGRLQRRESFADTGQQLDVRGIVEKRDVADQRAVTVEQHEASRRALPAARSGAACVRDGGDPVDHRRGAGGEIRGDQQNASAIFLDRRSRAQRRVPVVAAFDIEVRLPTQQQRERPILVEDCYRIDRSQRRYADTSARARD